MTVPVRSLTLLDSCFSSSCIVWAISLLLYYGFSQTRLAMRNNCNATLLFGIIPNNLQGTCSVIAFQVARSAPVAIAIVAPRDALELALFAGLAGKSTTRKLMSFPQKKKMCKGQVGKVVGSPSYRGILAALEPSLRLSFWRCSAFLQLARGDRVLLGCVHPLGTHNIRGCNCQGNQSSQVCRAFGRCIGCPQLSEGRETELGHSEIER